MTTAEMWRCMERAAPSMRLHLGLDGWIVLGSPVYRDTHGEDRPEYGSADAAIRAEFERCLQGRIWVQRTVTGRMGPDGEITTG